MRTKSYFHAPLIEVKAAEGKAGMFEGYASTWDLDLGGDVIERGAFKRTLNNWRSSKKKLPLVDQHNYTSVTTTVGWTVDAEEQDKGLWMQWQLLQDDQLAAACETRLKAGLIHSTSIGYEVIDDRPPTAEEKERGIQRVLQEIKLFEVSLVLWPMNEGAEIDLSSVKASCGVINRTMRPFYVGDTKGSPTPQEQESEPPADEAPVLFPEERRVKLYTQLQYLKLYQSLSPATRAGMPRPGTLRGEAA